MLAEKLHFKCSLTESRGWRACRNSHVPTGDFVGFSGKDLRAAIKLLSRHLVNGHAAMEAHNARNLLS